MSLPEWERTLLLRVTRDTRRLLSPWLALDMKRLGRVLFHSIMVGALAGGAACLFFYALEWAEWLLQGQLAGHHPLRPDGEVRVTPVSDGHGGSPVKWILLLLPALGGLVCGYVVQRFAPEAAGPGSDAYIDAFHNRRGQISSKVPVVKLLASLVTISTGGSAGREGPLMQSCAGIGSTLSRMMRLNDEERRILVVAGAAAGTGAIFRTPLGAALYAVEVLYRDDFETDAIVPAIIASVTGYSIFTSVYGPGHLFGTADSYVFDAKALPLYATMAVGISLFGIAFVALRDLIARRVFGPMQGKVPKMLMPAVGGALLGLMALVVPEALGTGYGLLQGAIDVADWVPTERGWLLLWGLAAAKIVSTSLTITSGGSGGEFGPALVVGGLAGGGFGLLFHSWMPELVPQPGAFALVGMGAMFGGIAHVPVSSLIMVCEMAGSYDLLVPLMLAEGITFVLMRTVKVFGAQVGMRVESPAHRHEHTVDVLESIMVSSVYEQGKAMREVAPGDDLHHVLEEISACEQPGIVVRESDGKLAGLISLDAIQGAILDTGLVGLAVAADVMMRPEVVCLNDNLHDVLHAFLVSGMSVLPVVATEEEGGGVVGVVTQLDVTRAYDQAVAQRLISQSA